jgi:alcohol dehydrogenase class IV
LRNEIINKENAINSKNTTISQLKADIEKINNALINKDDIINKLTDKAFIQKRVIENSPMDVTRNDIENIYLFVTEI